jgi:hypothetical protein
VTDAAEITAFLEKCLAEDEAVARACKPGPWMEGSERPHLVNGVIYGQSTGWPGGGHLEQVCMVNIDYAGEAGPANLAHMVRHDPARVLAEVETKRAILRLHMTSYTELDDGTRRYFCQDRATDPDFNGDLWAPCLTARLVAAPYAGRDGWDGKWAVT